ncbi:MAG TPA: DUF2004 domain-containing protein [Sulfurospirillum arcachonense]|nr:DUF2004 domain-containing protein [Sulfurospirillum arcachonense]HIP45888.1 DUF2004 domain-containing protein [Sulfurospirillum arcachonense]
MSKDIEETMRKAEEAIASLDTMAHQSLDDAEQKIKKAVVKGGIWVVATLILYFIWGTTWFFWVSFGISAITVLGIIFAKVMIAKARTKMDRNDDKDYDFDADIVEDEIVVDIETKIFGKQTYSSQDGLDFDNTKMILNGKENSFRGSIFDDLNSIQIEKAVVLLDSIEEIDAKARVKWLELLAEKDEEVCYFINVHHDEYGEEVKSQVLAKLQVEKQDNRAFIENLEFGSFHVTEGDEEDSVEIVMDYSLIWDGNTSFTDQILAMHFTDKLEYDMHTHDR